MKDHHTKTELSIITTASINTGLNSQSNPINTSMGTNSRSSFLAIVLISLAVISYAQTCSNHAFLNNQVFDSCSDLPVLQAHIHWNYVPSTKSFRIAYRAAQTAAGWIAWGINPTGTGMIGTQALVAFHDSNGSIVAYSTPITGYNPSMQPGDLSIAVSNISAEYSNSEMSIFAVVGPLKKGNTINHVWQAGNLVSDGIPQIHETYGENLESMGTLNLL